MQYQPNIDLHWDYPEFLYSLREIVHPSGPSIPSYLVQQRVGKHLVGTVGIAH